MWKWFAALSLFSATALAQENATAYDALRVVSGQLGRPAVNHIISVNGINGDPQPATWKVLLEDSRSPSGTREVEVTNGRLISDRKPERVIIGSASNSTIKTSRLNLDSSGAFSVASRVADRSSTRFATANYTLRMDERGDPVWIVALQSPNGRPVGTIHINCNRGNVVRSEGMFAGAQMEDVEVDRSYRPGTRDRTVERSVTVERNDNVDRNDNEDGDDERGPLSGVRSRIRGAFERAQDEARGMFDRVRRSFDDFITR
ncbi:MAG: hypothetical protein ABJB69_03115 [Spartobacteria bacterium]